MECFYPGPSLQTALLISQLRLQQVEEREWGLLPTVDVLHLHSMHLEDSTICFHNK